MNKAARIIGGLLFMVLTISALTLVAKYAKARDGAAADLPLLWHAPDFNLHNQRAELISTDDLRGHVWIANFVFTQCTSACPLQTSQMVILQNEIKNPHVRFVSFSVDPVHDTPAVLAAYAQSWNADEQRWLLLQTEVESLRQIAKRMQVPVEATGDTINPISHSSTFFLFDQRGMLRGRYANAVGEMQRLVKDVGALSGGAHQGAAVSAELSGKQIYDNLRCATCHDQDALAPSLGGLLGRRVTLADATTIIADADYVRESIQDPTAKMVKGYVPLMPAYRDYLQPEQLERLVTYVTSLEADPDRPVPSAGTLHTDVICAMQVRVTDGTPQAVYEDKHYYFCSGQCRTTFVADPQAALQRAVDAATASTLEKPKAAAGANSVSPDSLKAALGQTMIDPLCEMTVLVEADTPHALHNGKLYVFCNDNCRNSFVAEPQAYVREKTNEK